MLLCNSTYHSFTGPFGSFEYRLKEKLFLRRMYVRDLPSGVDDEHRYTFELVSRDLVDNIAAGGSLAAGSVGDMNSGQQPQSITFSCANESDKVV